CPRCTWSPGFSRTPAAPSPLSDPCWPTSPARSTRPSPGSRRRCQVRGPPRSPARSGWRCGPRCGRSRSSSPCWPPRWAPPPVSTPPWSSAPRPVSSVPAGDRC
ncbi:MAG: hypothetical protein AVDCRST_MAG41-623, partial [uncultured Corynebacteriales bacterium]